MLSFAQPWAEAGFWTCAGLAFALLLLGLLWIRRRCQKKSLPWPHWLAFVLENPYMQLFCNKYQLAARLVQLLPRRDSPLITERSSADQPPLRVLDLGCGAGRVLVPFAKACTEEVQITAMDMQPEMLAKAERAVAKAYALGGASYNPSNLKAIEFRQLTLHPPYQKPLGSFDLIYLVTVLGEIPCLAQTFNLLYRSLVLGGKLSITETLPDPCYIRAKTARTVAEAAGFRWLATRHGLASYTIEFQKPF